MKKITLVALALTSQFIFSQKLIVGNESLSVDEFKTKYKYGLENAGIESTINSTTEFFLLQHLASEKKVDTTAFFRNAMGQRLNELRESKLFPQSIVNPVLNDYIKQSKTERKIQVFNIVKAAGDTNNYNQIYNDVKSGKLTMDAAVETYVTNPLTPMFVKPGTMDNELYQEIVKTPVGGYTKLFDANGSVVFAKVLDTRPSLGYVTFGTISYPNDFNSDESRDKIMAALQSGKKFEEVAKLYGSTDHEKKSGGLVMGSPILPDEVYAQFKGKPAGSYTQPIKFDKKFFIFNIYYIEPYELKDSNKEFLTKEMMSTTYGEEVKNQLINSLKVAPNYKEYPSLGNVMQSYQAYKNFKNNNAELYQYKDKVVKFSDFKSEIERDFKELDKITPVEWKSLVDFKIKNFVFYSYNDDFSNREDIKPELEELKRNLFSEYIFSQYLKNEVESNPQKTQDYFKNNQSKYMWEKRAESRVAIISDSKFLKEVQKEIDNPKNWENLKKKFDKQLNAKNQILVHFEEGKVPQSAEIFEINKVPFKKGVHTTKIKERDVVIVVDNILDVQPMTFDEAKDQVIDAVTEQTLKDTIANQKSKVKVIVEPGFVEALNKNFKK